ncbi:MAG: cytochrome C oxidase subunit IV family protein [Verrucomicrobiales bacterium]|nr:cytochrome C oxidase subunit IV family protein [Verrucomicrobiales bacterium]
MSEEIHDWGKHKKTYMMVGIALFFFTGLTITLALFPPFDVGAPGPTPGDYVLGLMVATIKASLVALIFMHLNHERGLIYKMLIFTVLFCVALMALTLFAGFDPILEQYETLQTTDGYLMEKK